MLTTLGFHCAVDFQLDLHFDVAHLALCVLWQYQHDFRFDLEMPRIERQRHSPRIITGPETFSGTTDAFGGLEHDDILPGDYELTLTLEFFSDPDKHDPRDKIVDQYSAPLVGLGAADPSQVRLLGAVPRCRLAQLKGLLFDTNKAFLLPSAIPDLKKIRELYEQNNPSELLVVGHTDTTGQASTNDPLSLDRAKAALAYLEDDAEAWEKFYASSVKESQRWGETEDEHMRNALTAEGVPGVATMDRKTLIRAYMGLDGVDLDASEFEIAATAHGCGENFPLNSGAGRCTDGCPTLIYLMFVNR